MALASRFQQETQVRKSGTYNDGLPIANAESSAADLQDDLNYIRSVLLDLKGGVNWQQ
jgi:hypothetical protein